MVWFKIFLLNSLFVWFSNVHKTKSRFKFKKHEISFKLIINWNWTIAEVKLSVILLVHFLHQPGTTVTVITEHKFVSLFIGAQRVCSSPSYNI